MDCEQVRSLLSELLDGSLPDPVRTGVDVHLAECLSCRSEREGLEGTLRLLRTLPAGKAPPELLEGVRRGIAREKARETPLWKKLFLPVHVKIPLEAAAVALITLLVVGTQKQELPQLFSPRPAGRTAAAPAATEGAPGKPAAPQAKEEVPPARGKAPAPERPAPQSGSAPAAERENAPGAPASSPQDDLPAVPAQRVSTAGGRIEAASPPASFALRGPASRVMTIEVSAENRAGMEERIAAAALRLGGSVQIEAGTDGETPDGPVGVRVRLPVHSAAPFLDELSRLGTLPPEREFGGAGLSAGVSPEPVAYTVRIRVK